MSKKATDPTEMKQLESVLGCNVSRETFERLIIFREALIKWNTSINLVSPGTIKEVWGRHFLDSAQLYPLIDDSGCILFDFGSGAGFPGMVLALLSGGERDCYLFESDQRKCLFLKNVSRETGIAVNVVNKRIEDVDTESVPVPDVITARALSSLDKLLSYTMPWADMNPALEMLFLKGRRAPQEVSDAEKDFVFSAGLYHSRTSVDGQIMRIKGLDRRL